jgi:hypothetical protein
MAIVKWAKGIEFVSGLLSKRPKKGAMHSEHSSALLATHRVAETTNPNCTRIYLAGEYNRSTPVLADELARRQRFAAVAAAVAARAKDLNKITQDQQNFQAQKETGYKTMKSYLWSLEKAAYDQAHPQG